MLFFHLQNINRTFVLTSKPLNMSRETFFVFLVAFRYIISPGFYSVTCNCITRFYLVAFSPGKTIFVFCF